MAPIEAGALEEGDRVVIGVDTHLLPGNAEAATDDNGDDEASGDAPADEQADEGGGGGDDGDEGGDDEGDDERRA